MNFEKLTSKKWFVILMLVLIFPYGVFLMWKNRVFKPNTRIIISIFFFLFVVGLFTKNSQSNKEYNIKNSQGKEETKIKVDSNSNKFLRNDFDDNNKYETRESNIFETDNKNETKFISESTNYVTSTKKTYDINRIEVPEETKVLFPDFSQEENDLETIVLEYGKVGEYGKKVVYDDESYIEYFLPTGNYDIVEKKSKINKIYIESNSVHRNDEGFLENDIVNEVLLSACNNFSIKDGYHITLTIGTKLKLKKNGELK